MAIERRHLLDQFLKILGYNLAYKKFVHVFFQKIIEKSSGVVDESLKYVEAGVNLVSEDVQELSQAIVEDTQARFTNLTF